MYNDTKFKSLSIREQLDEIIETEKYINNRFKI